MSKNITSFLLSFIIPLACLLLPAAKADMRWEKQPGSGLYEAYHEGKLCIHVYKAGGVNYKQHRAFHAPEIQSMLEKNAILMGYSESNEHNPKLAPHLLGFLFFSFRGDMLEYCVPDSLNELKTHLSKAMETNQLIYEVTTDKKLANHQKLQKLNNAWQLVYRPNAEEGNLLYSATLNRLGAEIGAHERDKNIYFYQYYHRLFQLDKIRLELYACGNNPSAILSKADEWYNKIKNDKNHKGTMKALLCICMLMQLELAKTPADLKKINDLFIKHQQLNSNKKITQQCAALNDANLLLLQKDLLIGKKKPELLLPEIGNFTQHYRNRIMNAEKIKQEKKHRRDFSVADGMVKRQWRLSLDFFNGQLTQHGGDTVLATEALRKLGVEFPPKSWATYTHSRGELVVCNTPENIKKLIRLITKHLRK